MRRRRPGFTLLETMLCAFLVVLALGVGFTVARASRRHMSVRAVAMQLLADLRWARQRAMTTGLPCGIVLPPSDASNAYATVTTSVPGGDMTVLQVTNPGPESGTVFAPADSSMNDDWSDGTEVGGRGDAQTRAAADQWFKKCTGTYLVFSPTGALVTRLKPLSDGDRVLVIAQALSTAPSGPLRSATGEVYSIHIATSGDIRLESGAPVKRAESSSTVTCPLPPLPAPRSGDEVHRIQTELTTSADGPDDPCVTFPSTDWTDKGQKRVTVSANGHLQLTVKATDELGHRLHVQWGADTGPRSGSPTAESFPHDDKAGTFVSSGAYSIYTLHGMSWQSSNKAYVDTVEWAPPAVRGASYTLGVAVDDLQGQRTVSWISVGVIDNYLLTWTSTNGSGLLDLMVASPNGSGARDLTRTGVSTAADGIDAGEGIWSTDGLLCLFHDTRPASRDDWNLILANIDGSNRRSMSGGFCTWKDGRGIIPVLSPDGCLMASLIGNNWPFWSDVGVRPLGGAIGDTRIVTPGSGVVDPDPAFRTRAVLGGGDCYVGHWKPDSTRLSIMRMYNPRYGSSGTFALCQAYVSAVDGQAFYRLIKDSGEYKRESMMTDDGTYLWFLHESACQWQPREQTVATPGGKGVFDRASGPIVVFASNRIDFTRPPSAGNIGPLRVYLAHDQPPDGAPAADMVAISPVARGDETSPSFVYGTAAPADWKVNCSTVPIGPNGYDSFERPAWSPDGSRIAFLNTHDHVANYKGHDDLTRWDLCIYDCATGMFKQITDNNGPNVAGDFQIAWSPDSRRIAVSSDKQIHVVTVPTDLARAQPVKSTPVTRADSPAYYPQNVTPSWRPVP